MNTQDNKDAASADQEVLQSFLAMHSQYHNHKETIAFSIFGLEGAFFIGMFVLSQWPAHLQKVQSLQLAALFVAVWLLFHLALRFQLRNRRIAALLVASYYDALAQSEDLHFSRHQFTTYPEIPAHEFIDTCLLPVLGVLRESDIDNTKLVDGELIRPRTLKAFYLHLAKHKVVASSSWTKYAYPVDLIASFGSIFLLLIALLRVALL